jgi:hypothetical protein
VWTDKAIGTHTTARSSAWLLDPIYGPSPPSWSGDSTGSVGICAIWIAPSPTALPTKSDSVPSPKASRQLYNDGEHTLGAIAAMWWAE